MRLCRLEKDGKAHKNEEIDFGYDTTVRFSRSTTKAQVQLTITIGSDVQARVLIPQPPVLSLLFRSRLHMLEVVLPRSQAIEGSTMSAALAEIESQILQAAEWERATVKDVREHSFTAEVESTSQDAEFGLDGAGTTWKHAGAATRSRATTRSSGRAAKLEAAAASSMTSSPPTSPASGTFEGGRANGKRKVAANDWAAAKEAAEAALEVEVVDASLLKARVSELFKAEFPGRRLEEELADEDVAKRIPALQKKFQAQASAEHTSELRRRYDAAREAVAALVEETRRAEAGKPPAKKLRK